MPSRVLPVPAPDSWFSRRSITAKLAAIVVVFICIILALLGVATLASALASGVRAYVAVEGLWSKGQKDAVYYLTRYAHSSDEQNYRKYLTAIAIPLGDRTARLEMEKPAYDYSTVERGFVQGGNAAADVPSLIFLFRRFHQAPRMAEAIRIWTEADVHIARLTQIADELHAAISSGTLRVEHADELLSRIEGINAQLTPLEHTFSAALGEGSRRIRRVILTTIFSAAALLLGFGLWVSWRIAQGLRTGIMDLREGALRVAGGDLESPIAPRSSDELGELAGVFNDMMVRVRDAEAELQARAVELSRSNKELERFAYIASHDLQEPLRTVTSFTQLLARRLNHQERAESAEFIGFITDAVRRMQALIEGLLSYSRVSSQAPAFKPVDLNRVLDDALANLRSSIEGSGASVSREGLPVLNGDGGLLTQVLQNLIGNALKFRGPAPPEVRISAVREGEDWRISVRDNGIGIDPQHAERIFVLFQRLHPSDLYPGSGLGLAICQKIIERHGGRIWVEPGNPGSVFQFTLRAN